MRAKIEYFDGLAPPPALGSLSSLNLFIENYNLLRCKG